MFSILGVVNPGLITSAQSRAWSKESDPQAMAELGRALRPFILRRTKEQVLKDLPEKTELILMCELSSTEQKKYDELKDFYRKQLNKKVESNGLNKSKMDVLEALLRLRQASCHQGLIDKKLQEQPSSKFFAPA